MFFLIGSIILSSWLTISFKVVERLRISTFQAIVFNYISCVITGSFVNGNHPFRATLPGESWFGWALGMGLIFISLFNVVSFTAQKVGIAAASVAYKLSLVIPFGFSIYLYNEEVTWLKMTGIALALVSVILTCWPNRNQQTLKAPSSATPQFLLLLMPAVLFVGSGLLDSMIKYVEQRYLDPQNQDDYLITAFGSAAAAGALALLWKLLTKKEKFSWRAVGAGIAIGVPNYFSIWCLLGVLKDYPTNSSAIIPINNMGIVLFSTVVAWLCFGEKLRAINQIGIILAIAAIALIAYG